MATTPSSSTNFPSVPTSIFNLFAHIDWIIENMATQDDVNALSDRVSGAVDAINTGVANIRSDIATLQQENPGVDTSALEASVSRLESTVADVTELDSENPSTPVDPGE